jgi:uncharacterized protein (TIGR02444 family)
MTLWDYAVACWEKPGVSKICLRLQDRHGQCVALLLWRCWAASEGRRPGVVAMRNAIALARTWEGEVIAPLRAARRALAGALDGADPKVVGRVREAAGAVELDAERALIEALEALTPPPSGARIGGVARHLSVLMDTWNGSRAETVALSLAAALR